MLPKLITWLLGTDPKVKTFVSGLAVSAVLVLGAALINVGSVVSIGDWIPSLVIAEAASLGSYLVRSLGSGEAK